jgi:hypothetical protein
MTFTKLTYVHLFHVFFVGTLFLYVGFKRDSSPLWIFPFLKYLGIFVILFHSYKAYISIIQNKSPWVNYIHIFLVGPLLIKIGYDGDKTSRKYFELLLMAGFAAIGYHGYYLLF